MNQCNQTIPSKFSTRQLEKFRKENRNVDIIIDYLQFVMDENNLQQLINNAPHPWNESHYDSRKAWAQSLLRGHFCHILNGLVFEKRFPEDMKYGFINDILSEEHLVPIKDMENPAKTLPDLFSKWYDLNSPIRATTWGYGSIIRIHNDTESGTNNFLVDIKKYFQWKQKRKTKMIGYKASYNGKCQSLTYEVGKTYTLIGTIVMCNRGFHFCRNLEDVFNYYDQPNKKLTVFEIEVLGTVIDKYDKSVTDKIKILRIIPPEEYSKFFVEKYDKNGNLTYFKRCNKYEEWKEYDKNNNLIHRKDSCGCEQWFEYDQNNNMIHSKNSTGHEIWNKYDKNNNIIYHKDSIGIQYLKEYDKNGNQIHFKNSSGLETWCEYDQKGNLIYFKNSNGFEEWHEYDQNGNIIHYKDSEGDEKWREYDQNGNQIHFKNSNEYEEWKTYDQNGNLIHFKNSDGRDDWCEYDQKGNLIHFKDPYEYREYSITIE